MFGDFLLKKMLQNQLKNVPASVREKVMKIAEGNPKLLMKIAGEVQEKIKEGKTHESAMMEVMQSHKDELQKLL